MLHPKRTALSVICVLMPFYGQAENVEVITIKAQQQALQSESQFAVGNTINADSADWLSSVAGANTNKNGPVSGIAQYRGLYGDRVSVKIDGHNIIGSGPNAMDAPLSYVVPVMMESMSVYRGITPVSAGIDTLGGAVSVKLRKAEAATSDDIAVSGLLQAGYRNNNDATSLSSIVNVANQEHALLAYYSNYQGDDFETGDGLTIRPTEFDKTQFGLDYRFYHSKGQMGFSYHNVDTQDSGTPALPMDIDFVEADRFDLSGELNVDEWNIEWALGLLSSDHAMDNFRMRTNMMPDMHRRTDAKADTVDFKIHASSHFGDSTLKIGVDGYISEHDATITNPNNAMFKVLNFSEVEDNRIGAFVEWGIDFEQNHLSVGGRVKMNDADASDVSHHMAGSSAMIAMLMNNFNAAEKAQSDVTMDVAINFNRELNDSTTIYMGTGIKQRAPSYQERYLWLPMQSTGGLADGKTYVGNIELNPETAYQFNAGLSYSNGDFHIAPNVFYQNIDDYIQGTPSDNPAVRMVANMIGDETPLQFSNLEAKLYGADVNWFYKVSSNIQLSGIATYVRGERKDIDDNLYRIAPPNANLRFSYISDNWQGDVVLTGYTKQNKVSALNQEQKTAGYGTLDASFSYFMNDFTIQLGVDNLLDKAYASHLAGTNRAMGSDIPAGIRVPAEGRSGFVKVQYQF